MKTMKAAAILYFGQSSEVELEDARFLDGEDARFEIEISVLLCSLDFKSAERKRLILNR